MSLWIALSVQSELHHKESAASKPVEHLVDNAEFAAIKAELAKVKISLEGKRGEATEAHRTNTLLTNTLTEVKSKAQRLLVENFYVATRSAGLLDSYEEQITQVIQGTRSANMAYLPVLDEPKGIVDESALSPGPDWWGRPRKSKYALKHKPDEWTGENAWEKTTRWNKIRQTITAAMSGLGKPEDKASWRQFVSKLSTRPPDGTMSAEAGVVIAGGGPVYFSSSWVIVRQLRALGCNLPVEIWVTAGEVVDPALEKIMAKEGITIQDATDLLPTIDTQADKVASGMDKMFPLKAIAIVYSRFRHVLSLDADNFPAHNPERLLRSGGYVRTGAMFWPDYWPLEESNAIWAHIDKIPQVGMQQESGQLLLDKQQHWKPLLLALYMNLNAQFYYTMLQGDKDTFQFSWRALDAPFTMIPIATGTGGKMSKDITGNVRYFGHTMVQFDVYQRPLFFHKNLRKWTTATRPRDPKHLKNEDREWLLMKACRPAEGHSRNPYACRQLVDWVQAPDKAGFITFLSFTDHATTASVSVKDAVGYDLEMGILTAFAGLWAMPEYEKYVEGNFGPAGEYLMSCRKCTLQKPFLELECECRGLPNDATETTPANDGLWGKTRLEDPHDCVKAGFEVVNNKGMLACTGSASKVKMQLNRMQSDSTSAKSWQHFRAPPVADISRLVKTTPKAAKKPRKKAGQAAEARPPVGLSPAIMTNPAALEPAPKLPKQKKLSKNILTKKKTKKKTAVGGKKVVSNPELSSKLVEKLASADLGMPLESVAAAAKQPLVPQQVAPITNAEGEADPEAEALAEAEVVGNGESGETAETAESVESGALELNTDSLAVVSSNQEASDDSDQEPSDEADSPEP